QLPVGKTQNGWIWTQTSLRADCFYPGNLLVYQGGGGVISRRLGCELIHLDGLGEVPLAFKNPAQVPVSFPLQIRHAELLEACPLSGSLIGLSCRLISIGKLIQYQRSQAVTGGRKLKGFFPSFDGILVAFGLKESLCKLYPGVQRRRRILML